MEKEKEKELVEVFEVAKKAADAAEKDGGGPADLDRCLQALMRLREIPVTVKALVDTQVGKKLRSHLTKHPLKKIQMVASDLYEYWKKKVIEETTKNNKTNSSIKCSGKDNGTKVDKFQNNGQMEIDRISSVKVVNVENRDSTEKIKVEKLLKSEHIKVEKNEQKKNISVVNELFVETVKLEEKVASAIKKSTLTPSHSPKLPTVVKCNDAIRDKTRELFVEALSKVSGEVNDDLKDEVAACNPVSVALSLESVMFEKLGRSNGNNRVKYRSILFNLKDQKNPDLRRKVLLGEINPENIINMTAEEMASDERKRQNDKIKEKALFDCQMGSGPEATTDQFKCGRCGQRKCTYYQKQTRSADEPMTTYVTCVNCNKHWKFC